MANATATQDDDLLIIADDDGTKDSSSEIEFSFDPNDESEKKENTPDEAIIDLSTETAHVSAKVETPVIEAPVIETLVEEEKAEIPVINQEVTPEVNLDLGMDFGSSEVLIETPVEEETTKSVENSNDFSFDLSATEDTTSPAELPQVAALTETAETTITTEPSVATELTDSHESLNDIMTATIIKLQNRLEIIAGDKTAKTDEEAIIKEKIKELQAQVKQLEADMATLDNESDKITTNIAELEKMKLDPVKEHNAKRVVKK